MGRRGVVQKLKIVAEGEQLKQLEQLWKKVIFGWTEGTFLFAIYRGLSPGFNCT